MCKYDCPANKEKLGRIRKWARDEEYLKKSPENEKACRRKSRSKSQSESRSNSSERINDKEKDKKANDDTTRDLSPASDSVQDSSVPDLNDEILDHNSVEAKDEPLEVENGGSDVSEQNDEGQPKRSSIMMKLVDETNTSEIDRTDKKTKEGNSQNKKSAKTKKSNKKPEDGDEDYAKPPMSPELLIAIAVINLDPDRNAGASCTDIVAFLSIHFPYFSQHYQECKVVQFPSIMTLYYLAYFQDMVRRECGMSSSFESGRENFKMKAEINCGDRIHSYVKNNREKICQSMLEPEFLDIIIDRFVNQGSVASHSSRRHPPFDKKMLTHIALMKLHKRATLEQLVILLKFIFPALAKPGVMETYRKEFLEEIAKSKELDAKLDKNNITFALKEDSKEEVLDQIRACSLENLEKVGKSLLNESLFDLVLPIFQNND